MSENHSESQNRLAEETSPYLLQHADNPVHWLPWGDDAFETAKRENKPVFLSVGYSSCHWCHVMAHESFEDDDVAESINQVAICIKVDREERPDVDELYMTATQLMTGRGGWPNSVWLMPDRRPWYAGTYYPKASFLSLIKQVHSLWNSRRTDIEKQADELTRVIQEQSRKTTFSNKPTARSLDSDHLEIAENQLLESFDSTYGGFGGAPKFPPHASLRFLLSRPQTPPVNQALNQTLDYMAAGGIRDHIGGGFHRYATDQHWFLPHFEKMLYDNAQLLWVYSEAAFAFQNPTHERVVDELFQWAVDHFMDEETKLFFSAYDADSEGEEGKFYLWTHREILSVLGKERGEAFSSLFNIRPEGNYVEESTGKRTDDNIPHLSPEQLEEQNQPWVLEAKAALNAHRQNRVAPFLDDKQITAWNGLMISGLARAGHRLNRSNMINQAESTAEGVLEHLKNGPLLYRSRRHQTSSGRGFLDDYAYLADGLLELYSVSNDDRWLTEARDLLSVIDEQFLNESGNGYYFTSTQHEELLHRSLEPYDNATPSANAVAARAWLHLAKQTRSQNAFTRGESILFGFEPWILRAPTASMTFLEVLQLYLELKSDFNLHAHDPVTFSLTRSGQKNQYILKIDISEGSHISAVEAGAPSNQSPLSFSLITPSGKKPLAPESLPDPHEELNTGKAYTSTVTLPFRIDQENPAECKLEVHWQLCTDKVCLPPESTELSLPIDSSSGR